MISPTPTAYYHRRNADGSYDSICPHCYLTAGSATDERHLDLHELHHECDVQVLHSLGDAVWPLPLSVVST